MDLNFSGNRRNQMPDDGGVVVFSPNVYATYPLSFLSHLSMEKSVLVLLFSRVRTNPVESP